MLADNLLLLLHMNQRDYFHLKIGLHGTSGAGSVKCKGLRARVAELYAGALSWEAEASPPGQQGAEEAVLQARLHPEAEPGRERYMKALEVVEARTLSFFFQHMQLVAKTIGSGGTGTDPTPRRVAALSSTFEGSIFSDLDLALTRMDSKCTELLTEAGVKGTVVHYYEDALSSGLQGATERGQERVELQISTDSLKAKVVDPNFDTIGGQPWRNGRGEGGVGKQILDDTVSLLMATQSTTPKMDFAFGDGGKLDSAFGA
jgi:hypothetical protein